MLFPVSLLDTAMHKAKPEPFSTVATKVQVLTEITIDGDRDGSSDSSVTMDSFGNANYISQNDMRNSEDPKLDFGTWFTAKPKKSASCYVDYLSPSSNDTSKSVPVKMKTIVRSKQNAPIRIKRKQSGKQMVRKPKPVEDNGPKWYCSRNDDEWY